jgi:hypothetical protein
MKRTIQMTVNRIEKNSGGDWSVLLQCPQDVKIAPKTTVMTKAIFSEQEAMVDSAERVKVIGKGEPNIKLGETVEVNVVSSSN